MSFPSCSPPEEFNVAVKYFGVTAEGNFVDHSHPQPAGRAECVERRAWERWLRGKVATLAAGRRRSGGHDDDLLASAKSKMLAARAKRVRPHLDDKILASWNGLMLGALARASVVLGEEKYRAAAEKNLAFIREKLWAQRADDILPAEQAEELNFRQDAGSTLFHSWRDGERDNVQLLEGHAFLLSGVIELYEATLEPKHLDFAIELAGAMLATFFDSENGGFWQSANGAKDLILRVKDDYDGAAPSGNSIATLALLKLGAITGRKVFTDAAEKTLRLFARRLENVPQAMPLMLHALDFSLQEPRRVVIAGDTDFTNFHELLRAAHAVYQPNKIVLGNTGTVDEFARSLPVKNEAMVYICTGNSCQPPTSDAAQVEEMLKGDN